MDVSDIFIHYHPVQIILTFLEKVGNADIKVQTVAANEAKLKNSISVAVFVSSVYWKMMKTDFCYFFYLIIRLTI